MAEAGGRAASLWLRQAARDLADAEFVAQSGRHALACFLCHQSAEKAVVAYLLGRNTGTASGARYRRNTD